MCALTYRQDADTLRKCRYVVGMLSHTSRQVYCLSFNMLYGIVDMSGCFSLILQLFHSAKNKFEINTHKNKSYRYFPYLCICIAKKEACDIDLTTLSPIPLLF